MMGLYGFGYICIGFGIGLFASSYILEYELNKPIGEIEEYIPIEDRENDRSLSDEDTPEDEESSSKDIWNRERNDREYSGYSERHGSEGFGEGEDRGHSEFGSTQADLYNFYSSTEKDIYKPGNDSRKKANGGSSSKPSRKGTKDDKRREEFDALRTEDNPNLKNRYSKMYRHSKSGETESDKASIVDLSRTAEMNDILHSVNARTNSVDSYEGFDSPQDDIPEDDIIDKYVDPDDYEEFVTERVEKDFEIFLDGEPNDTVLLTYYAGDATLCDDTEIVVPNIEEVVGSVAISRLIEGGPGCQNGDVIIVRNLRTGINYQIVLAGGTYRETVAGLYHSRMGGLD